MYYTHTWKKLGRWVLGDESLGNPIDNEKGIQVWVMSLGSMSPSLIICVIWGKLPILFHGPWFSLKLNKAIDHITSIYLWV
jgi:hypothetical protein